MTLNRYTFSKEERLSSHTLIEKLFSEGSSFISFPFRISFLITEIPHKVSSQVVTSVSKKRFKRAYKRNLLKRRIKEAYRLNKATLNRLIDDKGIQVAFSIVYVSNEILPYDKIEKGIKKAILKLCNRLKDEN